MVQKCISVTANNILLFYKTIIQIFIIFNTADCELQGFVLALIQDGAYMHYELLVEYVHSLVRQKIDSFPGSFQWSARILDVSHWPLRCKTLSYLISIYQLVMTSKYLNFAPCPILGLNWCIWMNVLHSLSRSMKAHELLKVLLHFRSMEWCSIWRENSAHWFSNDCLSYR